MVEVLSLQFFLCIMIFNTVHWCSPSLGIAANICQPLTFCFYSRVLLAGAAASTARAIIETPLELAKVSLGIH